MNNRQLTFAREYRGYNQSELSSAIEGLSQPMLSKFEKGLGSLSSDIKERLCKTLDFPIDFFSQQVDLTIQNGHYRKKTTISKSIVQKFEQKCKIIGLVIDEFSELLNWPEFNFTPLDVESGFTPEHIALLTRNMLGLKPHKPVENIFYLLESNGLIIIELDEYEKLDGVSFHTEKGYPVIVINKNFSNDRKRFTLAHELGHILMHNEYNFPVSSFRDKEKEANNFAAEFLTPEASIKQSLYALRLSDLTELKRAWLTSFGQILRRAKDLNCISENKYTNFMIEMSRLGYNRKEPVDVFIDAPSSYKNAVKLLQEELAYTNDDFSQITNLPMDIVKEFITFENNVRLKILRGGKYKI